MSAATGGLRWNALAERRPDLARSGRAMFYGHGIGLGFLATSRSDGGPRVHPICPLLTDDGLYALLVPGPKVVDLRRDARYALHSETFPPPNHDDAFYVTGRVAWPQSRHLRASLDRQMLAERGGMQPWPGFEQQILVEFLIERCLLTLTRARDGFPTGHTKWSWRAGAERR
jgi:hypothetical protein